MAQQRFVASYGAVVQALYAATGSGDWAAAEALLSEDFFISEAPGTPMEGVYRGRGALRALYERVMALLAVRELALHDITVGAEHAVAIVELVLEGTKPRRVQLAEVFRFRDGLVCEIRPCYFDAGLLSGN